MNEAVGEILARDILVLRKKASEGRGRGRVARLFAGLLREGNHQDREDSEFEARNLGEWRGESCQSRTWCNSGCRGKGDNAQEPRSSWRI